MAIWAEGAATELILIILLVNRGTEQLFEYSLRLLGCHVLLLYGGSCLVLSGFCNTFSLVSASLVVVLIWHNIRLRRCILSFLLSLRAG